MKIAILGWGSLLWDCVPKFDQQHDACRLDGPTLPLEFSRKSQKRKLALTLVIDRKHGADCRAAHCISKRTTLDDAISDLVTREESQRIGFVGKDGKQSSRDPLAGDAIRQWAAGRDVEAVIWTDLASNFDNFTIQNAITHLKSLKPDALALAAQYVKRAPSFIKTPLRDALELEPWFQATG